MTQPTIPPETLRDTVRARYAAAASAAATPTQTSTCCSRAESPAPSSSCSSSAESQSQSSSCCSRAESPAPSTSCSSRAESPAQTSTCCSRAESPAPSSSCSSSAESQSQSSSCCGPTGAPDPITSDLYAIDQVADLPSAAVLASLGCGNPTALAGLAPGETVLDLGSGGGIDVLLSARRVGPAGFAYGLDMTDEMLALADRNAHDAGVSNVRFLKGEIEHIPLPDASVDVVISNCVINLSADKAQVLREALRVLRPGGRFAVSDVVVQGELPADTRRNMELWAGCVAGALEEPAYRSLLAAAGFVNVDVEVTRVYAPNPDWPLGDGRLVSAFVRAHKPVN